VPDGNLFPRDGNAGRPEIYVMGDRNPFRISVDSATGWLYWGEVGPDAAADDPARGPMGYDEFNQARAAGNFGWPYCIADNKPYRQYDFSSGVSGPPFSCDEPVNDSPYNTGMRLLPPAQKAWIWYPYGPSAEFPEMGTGGRTAMAGPVYHFDPSVQSDIALPAYYDNTLFHQLLDLHQKPYRFAPVHDLGLKLPTRHKDLVNFNVTLPSQRRSLEEIHTGSLSRF
jgi:cytochrome c